MTKEKSYSFTSTTRALFIYNQAREVARFFKLEEKKIKLQGNVVTIPEHFPFSFSVN